VKILLHKPTTAVGDRADGLPHQQPAGRFGPDNQLKINEMLIRLRWQQLINAFMANNTSSTIFTATILEWKHLFKNRINIKL